MHGPHAGNIAPVARAAIATVPTRHPNQVSKANRMTDLTSVLFVLLNKALDTSSISPVHAPQPVQEISMILRGNPIAPDSNRAKPLPFDHGNPPISNPTEAVNIPPKPTKSPANSALKKSDRFVYLVSSSPKSSSCAQVWSTLFMESTGVAVEGVYHAISVASRADSFRGCGQQDFKRDKNDLIDLTGFPGVCGEVMLFSDFKLPMTDC
jgi:hypothetical protein